MKRLLLFVGFVFIVVFGYGQLAVGDIAFIQYNADGTDDFAFVCLVDIPGGEVVKFTDNEEDELGGGEGTITWTVPMAGIPCGTIVTIDSNPNASVGVVTESNDLNFSGSNGDGLIAYQGADASPTFITALGNENLTGGVYSGANEGNLPAGLSLGVNAQSIVEIDNAKYNGSLLNDSKANLLAAIYDFSNWIGSETITQTFSGTFNVTSCSTLATITVTETTSIPIPITGLDYVVGNGPSTAKSFSVSASNLGSGEVITLTAPTNFQVSFSSGSGFASSLTLTADGFGTINSNNIYVVLAAGLGANTYGPSDVVISGTTPSSVNVSLAGEVTQPEVNFSITSASVSETGTTYNIVVNSDVAGSHSIDVAVTGGDATNGTEYTYSTQTVNFTGVTSQNVSITINDDLVCAGDHNVIFSFNGAMGCSVGTNHQLNLLITDDEQSIIPIDFQGFEGGGWAYIPSPATYNASDDVWAEVNSLVSISPLSGTNFWGMRDLNNTNGGGPQDHILSFSKNISSYSDVEISFNWTVDGYESIDVLRYEIWYEGIFQYSTDLCASGTACTSGWTQETVAIMNGVNNVELKLIADQDGGSDYAGFDDVLIRGLSCNTCFEPTISSVFHTNSPFSLTTTSANVVWNLGGDGDNKLVLMRAGSAVGSVPIDNNTYNANSVFGTGDQVGSNDYVIYNGNGTNVDVTGLNPGTEYFTEIFEYNCLPGAEDYLTSSSGTDAFVTEPEVVDNFSTLCVTDNTIEFSWNAPLNGNFDGYLLVARENSDPHAVLSALDPGSALGDNLDYTLANTYGAGPNFSRILYNGTGNNVTVSGLTEGAYYNFRVYSYAITTDGTEWRYSGESSTGLYINQMDVPSCGGFAGDTEATLNWTLPPVGCWDEILIVANGISGIDFTPTGNGSAYTADASYGGGTPTGPPTGYVVYKGTGTGVLVTSLTNNTAYTFEIFVRNGSQWSPGKEVTLVPSIATILEPGDLAIVAVNTNVISGDDEVCFIAFKTIQESTSIDFTDNGYERVVTDLWGGAEGTVRLKRTGGGPIAAGTPICFRGQGNGEINSTTPGIEDFDIYNCGVYDAANWTISSLNGNEQFNLNSNDQIWIMQGGAWTGGLGNHDGFYSGNVLYGWTAIGWEPTFGYTDNIGSTLFPGSHCFTTNLNGLPFESKVKYTGPTSSTSRFDWVSRINDNNNWTGYEFNTDYDSNGPDYSGSCITFPVISSTVTSGIWTGAVDDQWFECGNWSNLRVPGDSVDVSIPASTPDAIIDMSHTDAALYGGVASARQLIIDDGTVEVFGSSDVLKVNKFLEINGTGTLFNQNGGNVEVFENIEINGGSGTLDMNSPGNMSTLTLHRHWYNYNLGTSPNDGFIENNSLVIFAGSNTQEVDNGNGLETFHNVTLNKGGPSRVELFGSDMAINNVLEFGTGGVLDAYTDFGTKVIINSTSVNAIIGYEALNGSGNYTDNDKLVQGILERNVLQGSNYDYPIGNRPPAGLNYNPLNMNITSGNGYVAAVFEPVDTDGERREMNYFDNTNLCGGVPTIVSYHEFSNLGFWNMEGPSGMGYTVTLHPNMSTNPPIPDSDNGEYKVIKANSGTGDSGATWPYDQSQNTGPCVTTGNYYAASESFTGFSDFAIISTVPPSVVLPIELVSFEAKTQDRDILVNWVTATEINNDIFNLYHSVDGIHWGKINVQNGAGNSVETLYYSFDHKNPSWGVHYYQLEQVDFDGTTVFSGIVTAEIGFDSDISLYPIPADDVLFIKASYVFDQKSIIIHNDQGQLMSAWTFENDKINIQGLSNGIYFISFTSLDRQIVKKFIKSSGR